MIEIFNGRTRGLRDGSAQSSVFVQIHVQLREHLHHFRNGNDSNALAIFIAIALHADANGWAYPSYETLCAETGYNRREMFARSFAHLRNIRIEGKRIFAHYRIKKNGRWGRSYYHIFPDAGDIESHPQLGDDEQLVEWHGANAEPSSPQDDGESLDTSESELPCTPLSDTMPLDDNKYNHIEQERAIGDGAPGALLPSDLSPPAVEPSKPTRKGKPRYTREQLDPLMDVFMQEYFAPADPAAVAGQAARLIHGARNGNSYQGLLAYEASRATPETDPLRIAPAVRRFMKWWRAKYLRNGEALALPQGGNFIRHWSIWRNEGSPDESGNRESATFAETQCPLCADSRLAYAVPRQRQADGKLLWEIGGLELSQTANARTIVCPCCDSEARKPIETIRGKLHILNLSE